jgi:hypothetical protein
VHERDPVLEIQRVDDITLTLMQIHRAGVNRRRGLAHARAAEQSTGIGLQNRDLAAGRTSNVHRGMRIDTGAGEVAAGPSAQQAVVYQCTRHRFGIPHSHLGIGQRKLGGCAK